MPSGSLAPPDPTVTFEGDASGAVVAGMTIGQLLRRGLREAANREAYTQ